MAGDDVATIIIKGREYVYEFYWPWEYVGEWPCEVARYEDERLKMAGFSYDWGWHCPVFAIIRHTKGETT